VTRPDIQTDRHAKLRQL